MPPRTPSHLKAQYQCKQDPLDSNTKCNDRHRARMDACKVFVLNGKSGDDRVIAIHSIIAAITLSVLVSRNIQIGKDCGSHVYSYVYIYICIYTI